MIGHLTALLALATVASASIFGEVASDITRGVNQGLGKEISAVKDPIDQAITSIGSSECSTVKRIIGVAYDQLEEGDNGPDLNQLSLDYINSDSLRATINITVAADVIPKLAKITPKHKLIIFIHGFTDNPQLISFGEISEALIGAGQVNVIALDGSPLIHWLYLRSTTYVRFMGEKLGQMLAAMVQHGVDPKNIHLVGHSLGAHIASFTGKQFKKLTGQLIGRLSGLDPAGPCFTDVDPNLRLQSTDAAFVDVMHTDGGVYGMKEPLGHVDFFPNGGSEQPGCVLQTCSHNRAWVYYAESVLEPKSFAAIKCEDYEEFKKGRCQKEISYMGYPTKPGTRGLYYLRTRDSDEAPFGLGNKGLTYKSDDGIIHTIEKGILGI